MKTTIDGEVMENAGESLASALEAARGAAGGRLVVEVLADGVPVSQEELDAPPAQEPYASELSFRTEDPGAMLAEALCQAGIALNEASPKHTAIAEQINAGDPVAAVQSLGDVLTVWQQVDGLVGMAVQVIGEKATTDVFAGMIADSPKLVECLAELRDAVSNADWAGVSDVLAYELGPMAEVWSSRCQEAGRVLTPKGV